MKFSRKQLCLPYGFFLVVFVILPVFVVLYYALTDGQGNITITNFQNFFMSGKTVGTLCYSILLAAMTTVCCLLLAYPTAYFLAKGPFSKGSVLLMLFVIPMWINFTLRITAMKEILSVLEGNMARYPFFNTVFCLTYDFLPFMILPLYTSLSKLDLQYSEAALDLGANKRQVFWKVIIPLTMPGIISGIMMVFLPAMTNYVVLDMVYNSTYIMGSLIGSYFSSYDWNNGSMISMILLFIIFGISWISGRFSGEQTGGKAI